MQPHGLSAGVPTARWACRVRPGVTGPAARRRAADRGNRALPEGQPGHGFSLLFSQALRPAGFGKTRSWQVYTALRLNLQRRGKRRLPERGRALLETLAHANHTWSADFMADA